MRAVRCAVGVKPIRESSPVSSSVALRRDRKGKGQDNMARIIDESDAPLFAKQTYAGLTGRRCASLCLHMWRGCRSLTCLHGTHQATGVQVPPKLSAVVLNAERDNSVIPPDAISGRHYPAEAGRAVGRAEERSRKKQTPRGKPMDRACDMAQCESRKATAPANSMQTSDRCFIAKESVEPLSTEKQKPVHPWA